MQYGLLLDGENPRKIIRTLLHEARHAFLRFAVEHPWRAKPDESNNSLGKIIGFDGLGV